MPTKKILILPFALSIISHALILSATGLVDFGHGNRNNEDTITVNLEEVEDLKESAKDKKDKNEQTFSPLPLTEPETGDELSENAVELDNPDTEYASYLTKIKKKIENIWSYPRQAFERKKEGISTVKFTLDKSGKLLGNRIVNSSGYYPLDREALDAVRASAPYEPFPNDINLSRLHILASFRYRLVK